MNRIFLIALASLVLFSCGSKRDRGQIVGVKGKRWYPERPYGMALIPGGSYIMGASDEDIAEVNNAPTRTVTVRSFYMDETEITNGEYRQFVNEVRDSVVRTRLAIMADEMGITPEQGGIGEYAFMDADTTGWNAYQKYFYDNYVGFGPSGYEGRRLNKEVDLAWNTNDYPDEYYTEVMVDSVYLPPDKWYNGERAIDTKKVMYKLITYDLDGAARSSGDSKTDFYKIEAVPVYPDTTVWIKDFFYSYNEPMHNTYFWHEAYNEYPVVGVNWNQARAFCGYRTEKLNNYNRSHGKAPAASFRLPTEAEWEYAARGGLESGKYPWGGPYLIDEKGCFMANFKPMRGNYAADNYLYTVEAESFEPNDYNLYNMAGNVAEWTNSAYDDGSFEYVSTMNPNLVESGNRKKVIRGGSWKDVGYFLRVSARDYEYADSARSYIGFRSVQDYMGSDATARK